MIEIAPAPVKERVTPLKPSEALRLGCLTTRPIIGNYTDGQGGACAVGAMAIGFGIDPDECSTEIHRLFNGRTVRHPCPPHPVDHDPHQPVEVMIHLNDDHGWSREKIADWLAEQGM